MNRSFSKRSLLLLIITICIQTAIPKQVCAQLKTTSIHLADSVNNTLKPDTSLSKLHHTDSLIMPIGNKPREILSPDSLFIQKAKKYDLRNEIINMIVVQPPDPSKLNSANDHYELVNSFLPYRDKIIRNIEFKQLEVFGQNITDTTIIAKNNLQRMGNGLHINTQEQILHDQLLLKKGDRLDPLILADNERLIREMPSIQDVRVIVAETSAQGDSVDLIFITKDVWPIGLGLEIYDVDAGIASIWNNNLLGIGHELKYSLLWNYDKPQKYGHKLLYRINNIVNTFISADATYNNQWNEESFKIYFNRGFFTPQTKYAGGAGLESNRLISNIEFIDTTLNDVKVEYNYYDFWLGRALSLNIGAYSKMRNNIALTGRVFRYDFIERPQVYESQLYKYHSRTVLLGSIGISRQAFMKSRLIYGFGINEDIPYGSLLNVTSGYEINEFKSRIYFGSSFSFGGYIDDLGFLYQKIEYGGFFNSAIEQGALKYTGKYFTRLLNPASRYRYRLFIDLNYTLGINRYSDEYVELADTEGIRGLSGIDLRGDQKGYLKLESVCYSPHSILGFRITYFVFADFGLINNQHVDLFKNTLYTGFGAGVRIRNEHLVFNTLHIRLAYYPLYPPDSDRQYFMLTGSSSSRHETFSNTKPEIVKF